MAAWLLDTPVVWLALVPTLLLATSTETVQLPFKGMVRPLKLRAVWLLVKLFPEAPVQVPPADWAPLIAILDMVSLNPAPVRLMPLLFPMVKVIVEVPPVWMGVVPNALTMAGVAAMTVSCAVLLAEPSAVCEVVTPVVVLL